MLKFNWRMMAKLPLLLVVVALGLVACQGNDDESGGLADELPLDEQQPTFVFFYTDS